jgi:hypothetical protein
MADNPVLTGKAAIVVYHDSYKDDKQEIVMAMFMRGASFPEVQRALGMGLDEAKRRYAQVLKYYQNRARRLNEEWAKIQTLALYDTLRAHADRLDNEMKTYIETLDDDGEERHTPLKTLNALQNTQKFMYKIISDIRREYAAPQREVTREEERITPASDIEGGDSRSQIKQRLTEVIRTKDSYGEFGLTGAEQQDLEAAVTVNTMGLCEDEGDEEDEEDGDE